MVEMFGWFMLCMMLVLLYEYAAYKVYDKHLKNFIRQIPQEQEGEHNEEK